MHLLDKKEAIRLFVRENLGLFKGTFSLMQYRDQKRKFFVDNPRSGVGNPKDTEVVQELVEYLIHIKYLKSSEDLDKLLTNPFLKAKLPRAEEYREMLSSSTRVPDDLIDISKVHDAEYAKNYRERIVKEVIEQEREVILKGVESALFPSVLDEGNSSEPEITAPTVQPSTLWWQELNLNDDPFPSEEGLSDISDKYYDEIVCRTDIFKKYLGFLSTSPSEVLKNTIFFGDFGLGKTTLFGYLKKVMIAEPSFHPAYVQLLAEVDPYALLAKFKIRFLDELKAIFALIAKRQPESSFASYDPDPISTQIYQVAEQIREVSPCEGFVVFVDDLHKLEFGSTSPEIFKSILSLLASLQVFKAEFERKTSLRIAFYVAAVPAWENKLKAAGAISGSFSRYENMPAVTVEDAVEMLNKRFYAFAQNKQSPPRIDENLVKRVYNRTKEANQIISWRTFIKSIVNDELHQLHFDIVQASPLALTDQKKNAIRELLESDPIVKSQMNSLLYGGRITTAENRVECLKRLVDIYLKGAITETRIRSFPAEVRWYYERLEGARLTRKRVVRGQWVHTISPELRKANDEILKNFGLSIEDYLIPIYGARQLKTVKGERIVVELTQIEQLGKTTSAALATLLREASSNHELILSRLGDVNVPVDRKLMDVAIQSIMSLTKAWAVIENCEEPADIDQVQEFWSDNWVIPGAVSEFFKAIGSELLSENELRYALRTYELAFSGIVGHLVRLHEASRFLFLPRNRLTRSEVEALVRCRENFMNGKLFESMKECTSLVEVRLRTFCFNVFSLLYGGPEKRIHRLDGDTRKHMHNAKTRHGYPEGNEFEFLNRGQYKRFICGPDPQGLANWEEVFRYVFDPWKAQTTLDFLDRFAETNVKTSHNVTSAFDLDDSNEMRRYLGDCVTFLMSMNAAYQKLLTNWHFCETQSTEPRNAHYFSLHPFEGYKSALTPIFIRTDELPQLYSGFKSKIGVSPFVDLSDWGYIKSVFNCDYRQFYAFLSAVWKASVENRSDVLVRVRVIRWYGSEAKLEFSERTKIRKAGDGTDMLLSNDELKDYLKKTQKS